MWENAMHGVRSRYEAKQAGGTPHARRALVLGVCRDARRAVGACVRTSLVVEASWLSSGGACVFVLMVCDEPTRTNRVNAKSKVNQPKHDECLFGT